MKDKALLQNCNPPRRGYRTLRAVALAGLSATLAAQSASVGATFEWVGLSANWSEPSAWMDALVPVSAATTTLRFGGMSAYTATNNLATPFLLNSLHLTSTGTSIALAGTENSLQFTSDVAVAPTIVQDGSSAVTISNPLIASSTLNLGGAGTGLVTLKGVISGAGALSFAAGQWQVSAVNTYTGITEIGSGATVILGSADAGIHPVSLASGSGGTLRLGTSTSAIQINGGTLKATTRGSGTITVGRGITFTNAGGILDLTNINDADTGVQGGAITTGAIAFTTATAAASVSVVRWNGGQFGLSSNSRTDARWVDSENANLLRVASYLGTGALRFELSNGALMRSGPAGGIINVSMPVTYRGVAGGDPTSGPVGLVNPALALNLGRIAVGSSLTAVSGLRYEGALQVAATNGARMLNGPITIGGSGGGGPVGVVTFSGRSAGNFTTPAFTMNLVQPESTGSGQQLLWMGHGMDDLIVVETGGKAIMDLRVRDDGRTNAGVMLDGTTVIQPGATLQFSQSTSDFSPYETGAGAVVGNHYVQGNIIGVGNAIGDAMLDTYLERGEVWTGAQGAGQEELGGVDFLATSQLVVLGEGHHGLRIRGIARPNALLNGGVIEPTAGREKIENILSVDRVRGLTGSGGYLIPEIVGESEANPPQRLRFPAAEWSSTIPVGLKVVNHVNLSDITFQLLSSWSHHLHLDGGGVVALPETGFTFGPNHRGVGLGRIEGMGGIVGASANMAFGAVLSPGTNGIGMIEVPVSTSMSGILEVETLADGQSDRVLATQLQLNPQSHLTVLPTSVFGASGYTLASYTSLTGTFGSASGIPEDYRVDYGTGTDSEIRLVHDPKPERLWSGAAGSEWNTSAANWQGGQLYVSGDRVRFDETALGSTTVQINELLTPRYVHVDGAKNYRMLISLSGGLIELAVLDKNGAGELTIEGELDHRGGTHLRGGTLRTANDEALPDMGFFQISAGASLNLGGHTETIGSLDLAGLVANGTLNAGPVSLSPGALLDVPLNLKGSLSATGPGPLILPRSVDLGEQTRAIHVAAGGDLTFGGSLTGGGISKQGGGNLFLQTSNTLTGPLTVAAGLVRAHAVGALPSGDWTVVRDATVDLNGFAAQAASLAGDGVVNLGTAALTLNQNEPTYFAGQITGAGSVTKLGSGVFDIRGNNPFSGGFTLSEGVVRVRSTNALGTGGITMTGGSLILDAQLATTLNVSGGILSSTLPVPIPGTFLPARFISSLGVTFLNTSEVQLFDPDAPTTFGEARFNVPIAGNGTVRIIASTEVVAPNAASSAAFRLLAATTTPEAQFSGAFEVGQGARLEIRRSTTTLSSAGTARISLDAGSTGALNASTGEVEGTYSILFARLDTVDAPHEISITGEGTVLFELVPRTGSNATRPTFPQLTIGTGQKLSVNHFAPLPTVASTATFTRVVLTGDAELSPIDPVFGSVGSHLAFGEVVEQVSPGGSAGLKKSGAGILSLLGTASYSGKTSVEGGTLLLSGAITASSAVEVNGGTLAGIGSINGPTVIGDGTSDMANLSPGMLGAIGTLSTGPISLLSDAKWTLQLDVSTRAVDFLDVEGLLSLGSGVATLDFITSGTNTLSIGESFVFAQATSGVTGEFLGLPDGTLLQKNENLFEIDYASNEIRLIVVPEPASAFMALAGLALLGLQRRRQR